MIITCPNCRTRYQIKPLTLGSRGRTVRCSSCGHRWFVRPEGEPEAAPPPIPPAPSPVRVAAPAPELAPEGPSPLAKAPPPSAVGEVPARSGGGLAGWLVLALIVLLLAAAVLGRDQVVAALPPALPVYQHLGLPVTLHLGLEFADLGSSRRDAGGTPGVTVSGQVRNTTDREAPVPELRVALLDDRHRELRSQLFDPPQPTLPPGGSMRFELELPDPPTDARDFTISFADQP